MYVRQSVCMIICVPISLHLDVSHISCGFESVSVCLSSEYDMLNIKSYGGFLYRYTLAGVHMIA